MNRSLPFWSIHGTARCARNPMSPWDIIPFFSSRLSHFMRKSVRCDSRKLAVHHSLVSSRTKTRHQETAAIELVPVAIRLVLTKQTSRKLDRRGAMHEIRHKADDCLTSHRGLRYLARQYRGSITAVPCCVKCKTRSGQLL